MPRAAVALTVVLMLAGCTGSSGSTDAPAAPSGPRSGSGTPSVAASSTGSAADAGVDPATPAIATTTVGVPLAGDAAASVTVEVLAFTRKDDLVIMSAAVTPRNAVQGTQPLDKVLGIAGGYWLPSLIDSKNLKQYAIVRASRYEPPVGTQTSQVLTRSGARSYLWAVFPAPPADVSTVSVAFADAMPVLTDVPVG